METNTMQALDSLCANEFDLKIEGESVSGIFRISGLVGFKLDDSYKRVYEPIQISKMVQRDGNSPFNKWLRESEAGGRPTRTLAIVAVDDGVETRRWTINGAWISEVRYSEFNSASFEMVEEIFTIQFSGIDEAWPASK